MSPRHIRRSARLWLIGAVVAGGLVRVYLAWTASGVSRDGIDYLQIARKMAADWHTGVEADRQMGLSLLIRCVYPLIGLWPADDAVIRWQWAGQLVSLVGGTACIPLVFRLGRWLHSWRAGLLAAWIWALLPDACRFSADVLTDMPSLALTLAGLTLAMTGLRMRSAGRLFGAGTLAGAAYVVRAEAAALAAVATLLVLCRRRTGSLRRLLTALAPVAGFTVCGGPYIWLEGGEVFSEKPGLLRVPLRADSGGPALLLGQSTAASAATDALVPVIDLLAKLSNSLNGVWLVLGAAYLLLPARRRLRRAWLAAPLLLWAVHAAACLWIDRTHGYLSRRHVMLLDVGIVILAAATLSYARIRLLPLAKGYWRAVAARADAIVLAAVVLCLFPRLVRDINDGRWYIRDAARYLRAEYRGRPPPVVFAQYGWVPFYAGFEDWIEHRDPTSFRRQRRFAEADLAIVDIRSPLPPVIAVGKNVRVQLMEMARFLDDENRRGTLIYRVELLREHRSRP